MYPFYEYVYDHNAEYEPVGFGYDLAREDLILDAQFHLSPTVFVRLNTGIGLTSKAEDVAPEVGVVLSLPLF